MRRMQITFTDKRRKSIANAFSRRSRHLQFDRSGFEVHAPRDRYRIEWADITQVRWGSSHGMPVIEIEYAQHTGLDPEPRTTRIFDRYDASLPHVMSKLIEWRLQYGPPHGPALGPLCRD